MKTKQKFLYETSNQYWLNDLGLKPDFPIIIAGPCAVESYQITIKTALILKKMGINILRGGAYKPRTSPYSFQGLEEKGLDILKTARKKSGIKIVTELVDAALYEKVAEVADIIQIGSRNAQNFSLLKRVGKGKKPVLLKRGMMNTVEEFLMSAEYILSQGNGKVILCERGVRTFDNTLRNTLDVGAIAVLKSKTNLPVIVDPSHASGVKNYVLPLALAGMAAGAQGVIVEVHPEPDKALCDGKQSLNINEFSVLYNKIVEFYSFNKCKHQITNMYNYN